MSLAVTLRKELKNSMGIIKEVAIMYRCTVCGYIYNEKEEGTPFKELPDNWTCPVCNAPKDAFEEV